MKHTLLLCLVLLSIPSLSQTQAELNSNSLQSLKKAEKEMELLVNKIHLLYKEDSDFIDSFLQAQEKWGEYRDAQLKMKYPKRSPGWYGSNHSLCVNLYKTRLTKVRITALNEWLEESEEGDGCRGSIK